MTDIQAGDVVVCINNSPCLCCGAPYRVPLKSTWRVSAVRLLSPGRNVRLALKLVGAPTTGRHNAFNADRFRKIEPASDDFTQAIRACQPIIPELPRVTVEIVKLNPEIWPAETFDQLPSRDDVVGRIGR